MSDNNNDKIIFNTADIQRYLNGKMSSEEMHKLESHALDDPFLADAIDGYAESESGVGADISGDVAELHQRLRKRIESPDRKLAVPFIKMSWVRIAAMVLLIAGAGALIYYLPNNSRPKELITAKVTTQVLKDLRKDSIAAASTNDTGSSAIALNEVKIDPNSSKLLSGRLKVSKKPTEAVVPLKSSMPTMAPETSVKLNKPVLIDSVNIALREERKTATITDTAAALSEVVVTGYGTQKKISTSKTITVNKSHGAVALDETLKGTAAAGSVSQVKKTQDAEPVIGFPAYELYLRNNKKLVNDSLNIHGEVTVSFLVREDGTLSDYKIEKSLLKQLDDEAIRLVKEGPAWKVLKKGRAVATVTIKF